MSDQYRDALLTALHGCDLPGDLVAWLTHGLEVQRAGGDLLEALGLEGPDLNRRDDLLRTVIDLAPGESITARCFFVIECLDGARFPRNDMQHLIDRLQRLSVPRSVRQLRRILDGRRQDGWKVQGT
jgi:hypothetical protein